MRPSPSAGSAASAQQAQSHAWAAPPRAAAPALPQWPGGCCPALPLLLRLAALLSGCQVWRHCCLLGCLVCCLPLSFGRVAARGTCQGAPHAACCCRCLADSLGQHAQRSNVILLGNVSNLFCTCCSASGGSVKQFTAHNVLLIATGSVRWIMPCMHACICPCTGSAVPFHSHCMLADSTSAADASCHTPGALLPGSSL